MHGHEAVVEAGELFSGRFMLLYHPIFSIRIELCYPLFSIGHAVLLTTDYSLLTTDYSLLTAHYSLLTTYY